MLNIQTFEIALTFVCTLIDTSGCLELAIYVFWRNKVTAEKTEYACNFGNLKFNVK